MTTFREADFTPYHHGDPAQSRTTKATYRKMHRPIENDTAYLERPFVAWDGEGITTPDGRHHYTLLANSLGDYIEGTPDEPLPTETCLAFLLSIAARTPRAIHVIYGGSYDTNMILADWPRHIIQQVYSRDWCNIGDWRIGYRQGKSLYLARTDSAVKVSMTLYDVVSFFQCRFTKACDDYLGGYANRDLIVENKAKRSTFKQEARDEIRQYCFAELAVLVELMTELRLRLYRAGLRLSRWDGPGACASAMLKREGVKRHQDKTYEEKNPNVAKAARYAYAGGRFELVKFGHVEHPTYEYDINSAYPYALTQLPSLVDGRWRHYDGDPGDQPYALYHVLYGPHGFYDPAPLFRRDHNGTICYPASVVGWYWTPEIRSVRRHAKANNVRLEILEAWVFTPATSDKPFAFVHDEYVKRQALKAAGDGAHVGVKLGLNSLYGKLAQQVGWKRNPLRLPPYHQLEWAGYITSTVRAMVWDAIADHTDHVIAFETDAIFTDIPLHLDFGTGLGQWEATEFATLTYLQSGLYFGTTAAGEDVFKSRGFNPDSVSREQLLHALASSGTALAQQTRFIGMGQALQGQWRQWRRWITQDRELILAPTGKREHSHCPACANGNMTLGEWHSTYCGIGMTTRHSSQFPVEWINPDPNMTELSDLRSDGYEQWQLD